MTEPTTADMTTADTTTADGNRRFQPKRWAVSSTLDERSTTPICPAKGRTFLYSVCLCFVCIIWTRLCRPDGRNAPLTVPPVGLVRYVPRVPLETEG